MSGICGLWAFDESEPDLLPIVAHLEKRGPDGTNQWCDGTVALGHTLLATTPEALGERMPLTDPDTRCTITADVRLDNREELLAALNLANETPTIGDGELILRAYLEWGADCPGRLLGDFAFAIWDPRTKRLFCARDHMGMRQLVYHHSPGAVFAFATEADALIAHRDVPTRVNEGRIADFLLDMEAIDFKSTFFEKVFRLPPAHTLTVSAEELILQRYWSLVPPPELKLNSDEAYTKAFLKIFTEAVRCRLRSVEAVGLLLSGGVDSNAAAMVASDLLRDSHRAPLKCYSAVASDVADCVETHAIRLTVEAGGYSSTMVDHADLDCLRSDLLGLMKNNKEPFDGQMSLIRSLYLRAQKDGVKVVLDGASADSILASGNIVGTFLALRDIPRAWLEARARARVSGRIGGVIWIFLRAAWAVYVPEAIRSARQKAIAKWGDFKIAFGHDLITSAFARRAQLGRRREVFRQTSNGRPLITPSDRADMISEPWLVAARERYDRVASDMAVEPRDPFIDIRVIEFCLALPPDQLERQGWPKLIVRRAMASKVPEAIVWRPRIRHLGLNFTKSLLERWDGWTEADYGAQRLRRYVTPPRARPPNRFTSKMDIQRLSRLIILTLWLGKVFDPNLILSPESDEYGT